jgi:short-subunit dehydrogenase
MDNAFRLQDCDGAWAVVTGASAGIGRAFAHQLAAGGMHLLLVARREPLLQALAEELVQAHRVRVVPVALDLSLSGAGQALLSRIDELGDVRLRLLINNAGCGLWGPFAGGDAARHAEIVRLNCASLVDVTAALLPKLTRSAPSALVNVSSQAAYQPVPYMAVYGASKAFVQSFSQALFEELATAGVLVQTLVPAPTETEFDRHAGAYSSTVVGRGATEEVVRASLSGLQHGTAVASNAKGLWKQRLFAGLFRPEFVVRQVAKMFRPPAA